MNMIRHADEAENLEAELVNRRLEPFEKSAIIPLVAKDLLPPIATGLGMVDGTRKLNT